MSENENKEEKAVQEEHKNPKIIDVLPDRLYGKDVVDLIENAVQEEIENGLNIEPPVGAVLYTEELNNRKKKDINMSENENKEEKVIPAAEENATQEEQRKTEAIVTIVKAVYIAYKRGVYAIEEAAVINSALKAAVSEELLDAIQKEIKIK